MDSEYNFKVGDTFSSFDEFEKKVKLFEEKTFVKIWRRDSRTIAAAKKRAPKREFKPEIKYQELVYCCVQGGRDFKSSSKGERPQTSTFRQKCPFKIKIRASIDGQKLVVGDICDEHNHDVSKTFYNHLPSQRKLHDDDKVKACELLSVKANKKMVQHHLAETTGKVVLLKDIHNINTGIRPKLDSAAEMRNLSSWLDSCTDLFVQYVTDTANEVQGIFIQDETMKKMFEQYPEVILVDATHKTNDLRMPLYLMLVIDSNGESEIVAAFVVVNEEETSIRTMISIFKEQNPSWKETKVALTDKDMVERKVLKSEMPQISLLLCLFHALHTFKREITTEKMEFTSAQRTTVLKVLQRITYSPSEEEYTRNYHDLLALEIPTVTEYFNKNWHSIRTQWVEGLKRQSFSLGERTTNRVESTFQKIKSVTSSSLPLQEFLKILLKMISTFRTERQHRALTVLAQVSRCRTVMNEDDAAYSLLLTPYAYKIVLREQKGAERVTLTASENSFTCQSTEGELIVTDTTCSCTSYSSIGLPCKHIFAARKEHRIPLFDNSTVNKRWTREDYRQNSTDYYYQCTEIQHPKKDSSDTKPSFPQSKKTSVGRREIQQGSHSIKEIGKPDVWSQNTRFDQMMETLETLQRC